MRPHGSESVLHGKKPRRVTWRRVELEDEILSVLGAVPEPGERIAIAFRPKEEELIVFLAHLSVLDSMRLHRRLTLSLDRDPVVTRFGRVIAERGAPFMSFLAGARRREAVRVAR